jgi:sirohydrochlorin ferrochelatase
VILPLFMAAGAHVANDITALASELRDAYPAWQVHIDPPIGEHPTLHSVMQQIIEERLSQVVEGASSHA